MAIDDDAHYFYGDDKCFIFMRRSEQISDEPKPCEEKMCA